MHPIVAASAIYTSDEKLLALADRVAAYPGLHPIRDLFEIQYESKNREAEGPAYYYGFDREQMDLIVALYNNYVLSICPIACFDVIQAETKRTTGSVFGSRIKKGED